MAPARARRARPGLRTPLTIRIAVAARVAAVLVTLVASPVRAQVGDDVPVERDHAAVAVERDDATVAIEGDDDGEIARAVARLAAPEWIDRVSAIYALQRMGADAAPAALRLAAALADESDRVREEAAEALFRIGAPAVSPVARLVGHADPAVRVLAVQTLGRIGLPSRGELALLEAALDDPDPAVRDAAAHALALVAPQGFGGWLWKVGYEIGDEPWGIPIVLGSFVALTAVPSLLMGLRSLRGVRHGPRADARATPPLAHPGRAGERARDADDVRPSSRDLRASRRKMLLAARRASRGASRDVVPPQGVPHAIAGLIAILVGVVIAAVAAWRADATEDERHGMLHFAALWVLFGYLFVKLGAKGAWTARRARQRRASTTEPWLRDRDWRRDGTGPVRAERVAPSVTALVLWVLFLTPFHTVWRLPASYWGVWIVLALFDLLALAMLVATARRVWRRHLSGRCFLRWQGVPVEPGRTLVARFESARSLAGTAPLEATLRCLRDRAENPVIGDEAAPDAEEIYAERKTFALHDRPEGGSWAQLSFTVPDDAPGTSSFGTRPTRWVLTVALPAVGPDFRTTFPVPIYR